MSDKDYKVSEETRAGRRVETQEVFTPESVVKYMLDRLDPEDFVPLDKNWLDNSCGNGNLLVGIIQRRLAAQPGGSGPDSHEEEEQGEEPQYRAEQGEREGVVLWGKVGHEDHEQQ